MCLQCAITLGAVLNNLNPKTRRSSKSSEFASRNAASYSPYNYFISSDPGSKPRQLTSAMKLRVLVEELGSVAALIAIPSGVSSLAFALEISERTAVSLSWIWAVSRIFDFALIKADIIFLLIVSWNHHGLAYQSSASVIEKLLGKSIS